MLVSQYQGQTRACEDSTVSLCSLMAASDMALKAYIHSFLLGENKGEWRLWEERGLAEVEMSERRSL